MASTGLTRERRETLLIALTPWGRGGRMFDSPQEVTASSHDVTALLQAWSAGDTAARDQLMAVVYREQRDRAARLLRRERRDHSLQPTALVHEV